MTFPLRIRSAFAASLKHLLGSLVVALTAAALVFGLWYPYPYSELVGGRELFLLLISVDVICGPLLTLVVFDPKKPGRELWRDIGIVVLLQLTALVYGLNTVAQARPVFLAYEKDLFRVVRMPDIDIRHLADAPEPLRDPGLFGPRLIGVRVEKPGSPNYLKSIKLSLNGLPSAFRPGNWVDYKQQRSELLDHARPLGKLRHKYPDQASMIDAAIAKAALPEGQLGYLPLTAGTHTDWVVLVSLSDAQPKGFLPLDGWD